MASESWFVVIALTLILGIEGNVKSVTKDVDLTTGVVRQTLTIKLANTVDKFYWCIPTANVSNVAKVSADAGKKSFDVTRLQSAPKKLPGKWTSHSFWEINLKSHTTSFTLTIVLVDSYIPLPGTIREQSENQLVVYYDNAAAGLPYDVEQVTSTYKLPSSSVESYTSGGSVVGTTATFGPYQSVKSGAEKSIYLHFRHNGPHLKASKVKRVLQLSHWGMLGVEEEYTLINNAAKFIGSFSRVDYENTRKAPSMITSVIATISASSKDIYFRDIIGNISTSSIRSTSNKQINVELTQRYPMLGGWQSNFFWGYNLPLGSVLENKDGLYRLTFSFAPHIKKLHSELVEIEVRLPEGASVVKVKIGKKDNAPYEFKRTELNLDVVGRPTVVLNATNIVDPDHSENLYVYYTFSVFWLLLEPLLITTGFLFCFIISMIYVRLP